MVQSSGRLPVIVDVDVEKPDGLNNRPSSRCGRDYMCIGMDRNSSGDFSFSACPPSATGNVSAQLALSSVFRRVSHLSSGEPQQNRNESKQHFSRTEPEREIPFGAAISAIFSVWIAWQFRRRWLLLGTVLFLYGVIGVLGHFDPYSLVLLFGPFANKK
jgi:hypothetical protein